MDSWCNSSYIFFHQIVWNHWHNNHFVENYLCLFLFYLYMWIELETESYDDDEDLDGWCNDVWLSWLSPRNNPRLEPLFESVQRSLDEILQLEYEIISENTEVSPELWIHLFAQRFRELMDIDSSGTKSQIKRRLYFNE